MVTWDQYEVSAGYSSCRSSIVVVCHITYRLSFKELKLLKLNITCSNYSLIKACTEIMSTVHLNVKIEISNFEIKVTDG